MSIQNIFVFSYFFSQITPQISTLRFGTRMMCVANEPLQNIHFDPVVRSLYT